jgi:hypothetical protein
MKKRCLLLMLLALGLALLWYYYRDRAAVEQREDPSMIFGRLWVDSSPAKDTDYVHALALLKRLPVGVFQRASSYRMVAERFDYRRKNNRLELTFPQSGKEAALTYRIWACDDLPPFDLCLELSRNPWEHGPKRYHGMREQRRASARIQALSRRVFLGLE